MEHIREQEGRVSQASKIIFLVRWLGAEMIMTMSTWTCPAETVILTMTCLPTRQSMLLSNSISTTNPQPRLPHQQQRENMGAM